MAEIRPYFAATTLLSFLLLIQLQTSADALCTGPTEHPKIKENNMEGDLVATITIDPGVTLTIKPPANPDKPFKINGNLLLAGETFDAENTSSYVVNIVCKSTTGSESNLVIVVIVENENDNPPVFEKKNYVMNINEMQPINTVIRISQAKDLDGDPLSYTLMDSSNSFRLSSSTSADVVVNKLLKYDDVKTIDVTLMASDTKFNDSTTIRFNILDVDNRPPWFKPCTEYESGDNLLCLSSGYTGSVTLGEKEPGALSLNPGSLYAIDGDSGINEEITYSILSGDDGKLFEIDANTGSISMTKPADVMGPITLTVLAAQKINGYQTTSTTVTFKVLKKSENPPEFPKSRYEGTTTAVGNLVMDQEDLDKPLQILATDADYESMGGLNPQIEYSVDADSGFSFIGSYLVMTKPLPEGPVNLQVLARDTSNEETATTQLVVNVKSGPNTTTVPPSTTDTAFTAESTTEETVSTTTPSTSTDSSNPTISTTPDVIVTSTNPTTPADSSSSVSTSVPSVTSASTTSATKSTVTTGSSDHTSNPSPTSDGSVSTASTAYPHTVLQNGYGSEDMAALGASLGALVFVCLVVIAVLIFQIRKENKDWKKIYESNVFRGSLTNGSLKNVLQYTNESFQKDEDGDHNNSGDPDKRDLVTGEKARKAERNFPEYENVEKPSVLLQADNISQTSSQNTDSEKEVTSILTKERRMDEGYKSVWFKEDIDPNAKEEVVIIPDSRENDSEEEEEQASSDREEDEEDNTPTKTPRVAFKSESKA